MANTGRSDAGKVPPAWVIALVAAILVLVPTSACVGIMMLASTDSPATGTTQKR